MSTFVFVCDLKMNQNIMSLISTGFSLLSLSDFWVVFSIEGTIIWIASGCYKRIKRFSIVFKVGHVKFVSNSGDRIYILMPNHRAHIMAHDMRHH